MLSNGTTCFKLRLSTVSSQYSSNAASVFVKPDHPTQLKTQSDGHLQTSQQNSIPDSHSCTAKPLPPNSCATLLVQWCPACFGGNSFRKPLSDGGDIHVATDGDCPSFYDPVYFLPKAQVDAVGHHIEKACKCQPKKHNTLIPDEAIDQCETSYEAANGKKNRKLPWTASMIPTPPVNSKNIASLSLNIFSPSSPSGANAVVLYDVGCVLAHSLTQVTSRLHFATTVMHAYGHEWACQLVYNPRLAVGLGLSDGEGTERLWSWIIKLIGIERASSHQCCIWLIDHHAAAIGHEMWKDLGSWLRCRMKKGVTEQSDAAQKVLNECQISISELQSQWNKQRSAQLSIRADAPARLKKELDSVLSLQADLDSSERALQAACIMIEKGSMSDETLDVLDSMERGHHCLLNKIKTLYTSLNVQDKFPELQGIHLEFVRVLLMARNLKINIRK
ncbi:hypothetical protein BU15DRAFT_68400, partial [Melanogaster broomeanus]